MDNFWLTINEWFSQHSIWKMITAWLNANIPNVIYAIVIFVVGRWLAKTVSRIIEKGMNKTNVDNTLSSFARHLIYASILVFFIVAAMSKLGIETASFTVVVGAAGLAIGLALQGSLSNFAAGVMLIIFKPLKVGDFVEIAGTKGTVTEVEIFNTIINTPDNVRTVIPNSHVTGANILNYTANGTRRVDMVFGISYGDDIRKAKLVIEGILAKETRILPEPKPVIGVLQLADSGVNIAVRPWVKVTDYWSVYFALNESIKLAIEANGMTIPFPQRDVHIIKEEPLLSKN
jgi:small conductance mechanosensitive channel